MNTNKIPARMHSNEDPAFEVSYRIGKALVASIRAVVESGVRNADKIVSFGVNAGKEACPSDAYANVSFSKGTSPMSEVASALRDELEKRRVIVRHQHDFDDLNSVIFVCDEK